MALVLAALVPRAFAAESASPVGLWQTFDDKTHRPRGSVRVYEQAGRLFGRIEKDKDEGERCVACRDERKDQPIDGLVIIRDLRPDPQDAGLWSGGDVVDPDTGKLYRLTMRVDADGSHLVVRGYIGVSLLGRSQTWARLPDRTQPGESNARGARASEAAPREQR